MKDKTIHITTGKRIIIGDKLHRFARRWAKKWLSENDITGEADEWDTYGSFDVNLYVDNGQMSITAYSLVCESVTDSIPNVITDTNDYINLLYRNLQGKK